jgi:hypothetical protein
MITGLRKQCHEELNNSCSLPNIFRMVKRIRLAGHVGRMEEKVRAAEEERGHPIEENQNLLLARRNFISFPCSTSLRALLLCVIFSDLRLG